MKNDPKYCKFCRRITFTKEEKCTECKVSKKPVTKDEENKKEPVEKAS